MNSTVTPIGAAQGSYLMRLDFYRGADGTVRAELVDMPVHVIESEAEIGARFAKAASWCLGGMLSLMRQGTSFDCGNRPIANEDTPQ